MKLVLVLALFFLAVQADTIKEKLVGVLKQCVDEKDVDKYVSLVKTTNLPTDDEPLAKALVCYWRKLGIIKEDDSIDTAKVAELSKALIKALNPESTDVDKKVDDAIKKCQPEVDALKDSLPIKSVKSRNCLFTAALAA